MLTVGRLSSSKASALVIAVLLAGIGMGCFGAYVQAAPLYPDRPIRLIVGFSAGGATDTIARMVGHQLSERLGQSVVVENKPGAGGTIATGYVASSPADGYTLLFTSASHAINATLYKSLPYDPVKDFEPVVPVASTLNVLVIHPSMQASTVKEFIDYVKAHPGELTMASGGIGSSSHLAGVLFNTMAGIKVTHIPYKGTADSMRDLAAGEVDFTVDSVSAYLPYFENGSLRPLGVGDLKRSSLLPKVPTIDESGLSGYEVNAWVGILAPAHVPRSVVELLNRQVNDILALPKMQAQLQKQGSRPLGGTPENYAELIQSDIKKFSKLIELAEIPRQ
ncbi:tripartite tricarboxylate transporter substrate binding protein [Allopusillimonas soli]|uniref:Tripartite tricarboxylate transporter substrate binding protein n=1 Tax=Allopusillimonas soli TaxID=659016 RepID=A0A853FDZ9_9BURK|nr:tripartite tricarboxylate transporter substrate binding protein [Allopusillimonas soli]NYT36276.1 tripartite tricarboxylate transporter substrate binding protein [Allopusillimonas soli]TEA76600.1 tripartite tricarboxylate transporter substrate binding protein [Allopusillimonas soli]